MKCADLITRFLVEYLEGSRPAETLADFEHHLDVCPSCVEYLRGYRLSMALVAGVASEEEEVPEELVAAILDTVKRTD
jgi:predicted anti-sigma-YlaC factor YlaD